MRKMNQSNLFLFCLVGFLTYCTGCTGPKNESSGQEGSQVNDPVAEIKESAAVCIWDKIAVREEPSSKSKWVTSISLGETLTSLGTIALDTLDKDRKYVKVRLADGTEGWSIEDFIIPDAKVGVFQEDNVIYKRPDLLTKTDNKFSQMDIVAIKSVEGEWVEIVGKRSEGKWIESGWVKERNLSQSDIDVAVAKFALSALSKESPDEKIASLQEIIANQDFSSSTFIPLLETKLTELTPAESVDNVVIADSTEISESL